MLTENYKEKFYVLDENDLYKILGVDDTADLVSINKIYKQLAKQYHPDIIGKLDNVDQEKLKKIFTKFTSAYNILKDNDKRKKYDYERRLKKEYERSMRMSQDFMGKEFNKNAVQKSTVRKDQGNGFKLSINTKQVYSYDKEKAKNEAKRAAKSNTVPPQTKLNNQANVNKTEPKTNQENTEQGKASEEQINAQSEALYNEALNKYKTGNIDGAIMDLQTAIVVNSKMAKYYSCLGLFMREKGWHGYAQSQFKKALQLNSKDKIALKYTDEVANDNNKVTGNLQNDKKTVYKNEGISNKSANELSLLEIIRLFINKILTKFKP